MALETLLVVQARNGDTDAFEKLLTLVEKRLFATAYLLCGQTESAEDLLQDTFLALYEALPRFQGRSSFYTFAYRVLLNTYHKKKRRRSLLPLRLERKEKATTPSPAQEFARTEAAEKVREAIRRLPVIYQEAIVLRYLDQLSYAEMAKQLNLPEGTVKSRLFKAKKLLARLLPREHF